MSAPDAAAPLARPSLGRTEFIALMGMVFATVAFGIDAMLPALPEIAGALSADNPNAAQYILTSFVLGMGLGTLFVGPLSDAFGRKPIMIAGAGLYVAGAALAYVAPTLELILAARVIQGIGAAGPRIVALAMIRDQYSGRVMAQIVSYVMMIFTVFPALAPLLGAAIIAGFGWRAIFLAFIVFSVVSMAWLTVRQPETLPPPARRPIRLGVLYLGAREALRHPQVYRSTLVQTCVLSGMFGVISTIQQTFDQTYGLGQAFPFIFAAIALLSIPSAPINGWLVVRTGMRPLIRAALWVQTIAAPAMALLIWWGGLGAWEIVVYFLWSLTVFGMLAFTMGNLNALALEPMGHIAGLTASIMAAAATVGGALFGAAIGQLWNGSPVPVALGIGGTSLLGALIMIGMPREGVDG